jgi:hypothetical protein
MKKLDQKNFKNIICNNSIHEVKSSLLPLKKYLSHIQNLFFIVGNKNIVPPTT